MVDPPITHDVSAVFLGKAERIWRWLDQIPRSRFEAVRRLMYIGI